MLLPSLNCFVKPCLPIPLMRWIALKVQVGWIVCWIQFKTIQQFKSLSENLLFFSFFFLIQWISLNFKLLFEFQSNLFSDMYITFIFCQKITSNIIDFSNQCFFWKCKNKIELNFYRNIISFVLVFVFHNFIQSSFPPNVFVFTALFLAYSNGAVGLCCALLRSGARIGTMNKHGMSIFNAPVATKKLLFKLLGTHIIFTIFSSSHNWRYGISFSFYSRRMKIERSRSQSYSFEAFMEIWKFSLAENSIIAREKTFSSIETY